MKKKILTLTLALMMVVALAACGGKDDPKPSGSTDPGTSQQQAQTPNPGASQDQMPSGEETEDAYVAEADVIGTTVENERIVTQRLQFAGAYDRYYEVYLFENGLLTEAYDYFFFDSDEGYNNALSNELDWMITEQSALSRYYAITHTFMSGTGEGESYAAVYELLSGNTTAYKIISDGAVISSGGEETPDNGGAASSEIPSEGEDVFAFYGLTEDAVKPDVQYSEIISQETNVRIGVNGHKAEFVVSGEKADSAAYHAKLFGALAAASDDGKVYAVSDTTDGINGEISLDDIEADSIMLRMGYLYNGREVCVSTMVLTNVVLNFHFMS